MLNDRLSQAMALSKRNNRYGALIFLDLDNFKSLNDKHGHGVGDLLLIEVAHRINSCVREVDFVARFGGDEFVVIIGDLGTDLAESTAQTNTVAEKIRAVLNQPYVLKVETEGKTATTVEHHCTSSLGVALFLDHEVSTDEVIRWADIAMYQAKEAGGNSIRYYDAK
jgi:diguanylate cyclase (GGDEF)-like protein